MSALEKMLYALDHRSSLEVLQRQHGYFYCDDCGREFSSCEGDRARLCGNCAATTHLPRCGYRSIIDLGLGSTAAQYCQRPSGHTGQHTYTHKSY